MKKLAMIFGVAAGAVILYLGIHASITREARAALAAECPELIWLKREYQLDDQQFSKIEALHASHDVRCKEACRALSGKQKRLLKVLKTETVDSALVQQAIQEWREERSRSQNSIIKHMFEVSAEMDPEQGIRYREHVFQCLIVPGRTPHVDREGDYDPQLIQHLKK